jgi:hypothetical protein
MIKELRLDKFDGLTGSDPFPPVTDACQLGNGLVLPARFGKAFEARPRSIILPL